MSSSSKPAAVEQPAELLVVLGPHLLGDAVGAQRRDIAAHVDARLVDGVAERLAGVAAHHEPSGLRHEGAHVADVAADDDVDALHRNAAPRSGIALDHQQPAVRGGTRRLRCVALDPDDAAHHVLGDAGAGVAVDGDLGLLVHPGGVVADVAVDRHPHRGVQADRDIVCAGGVFDDELTGQPGRVQRGVHLAQRHGGQVECRRHRRPCVDHLRFGFPDRGALDTGKACQGAVFAAHRDPVGGLGDHRGLAGDRVAHHGERIPVGHQQRVEAVERCAHSSLSAVSTSRPSASCLATNRAPTSVSFSLSNSHSGSAQIRVGWWRGWRTIRCAPGTGRARRRRGGQPDGRHRRLGRHPGVPDALPALRLGQAPASVSVARMADPLEHREIGTEAGDQRVGIGRVGGGQQMSSDVDVRPRADRSSSSTLTVTGHRARSRPRHLTASVVASTSSSETHPSSRRRPGRVAVDGDAGRVAAAVAHLAQHAGQQFPEPREQLRVAQVQTRRCRTSLLPSRRASEGGQVLVDLPRRDRAVVGEELRRA